MALQNLHEMIRNLSSYIKSLEVLCESGVRLAKNFERLLSPGPLVMGAGVGGPSAGPPGPLPPFPPGHQLDSDLVTQSVATWELAHKVATADANALISELLPLLQETVQSVMKDPVSFHSSNTYEVFRSCFSAFFQIQWRFCSLYLQCTSSQGGSGGGAGSSHHSFYPRSPDAHIPRSPTILSFSSSSGADRRESTESCMSGFSSLPRSSFSGLSSVSSRSTSPSPLTPHQHYGHGHRSRNSTPSVKFTPSQPPSPLLPYGDSGYPSLFRRWSAHTHNFGSVNPPSTPSSGSGGPNSSSHMSAFSTYGSSSGSSYGGGGFTTHGFSRRWSVPAHAGSSSGTYFFSQTESSKRLESSDSSYEYGLLDAINLLSAKPSSPNTVHMIAEDEPGQDYSDLEQSTSLWPPSETMPGVVLTTCGSEPESGLTLEGLQRSTQQAIRLSFGSVVEPPVSISQQQQQPSTSTSGILPQHIQSHQAGEYTLFGNPSTGTPGSQQQH